ncbi:MAG: GlsB/YeaQ/YmgE family stress response membrane protein [Thalassolituus oleivorans]|uniref:GlsB/YeaQ/YmgE family stress response membrane protein n=1 Tax=Thalassolituus oleivorans TaxID=187493 RepID=UPI001B75D313|nr:GlsB/YeaQ/YmgE family stress response membrane protein [Thalassolituus oleivorans]MBQ0726989.1 GlsB/YeaQ/YmgE family stress response membrane protein [Thalassolituus oleivorans]MBQ0780813.1 GlsB/YeaQ/YmgE family stress response membrane protein [Thalassolituus oleivorans]
MDVTELLIFLAIGALAGWLAGVITKGGGFGLLGDIVIGILGAVVGGYVFGSLGIAITGLVGSIITATLGAVILLFLIRLIKRA